MPTNSFCLQLTENVKNNKTGKHRITSEQINILAHYFTEKKDVAKNKKTAGALWELCP